MTSRYLLKINLDFKYNSWFFAGVLLACFLLSTVVRYQQLETWKKNPAAFFVGERPMMTTLDAPYWLRWAREYNEGIYLQKDGLRVYPESSKTFQEQLIPEKFKDSSVDTKLGKHIDSAPTVTAVSIHYSDVPLLSFLIAHLSPFFNYNYYLTGTLLIPVLASLFIFPLGIFFFKIGLPLAGLLGGLIGTFAGGYYMRSSIGRIDTDMLNLFFPVLAGLLILLAGKAKKERDILIYALGAGLSLFLFQWWYGKPGFTLVYFMLLVFSLFVQKVRFKTILLGAFLFVLCAQPEKFLSGSGSIQNFTKNYFTIEHVSEEVIDEGTTAASFPNTMTTISEASRVPINEVLRRVLSNTTLDWIGLLGVFGLVIFKWRVLLPLVPMMALGVLSFQSSNRFIMYLAPFIGIGLGWSLQLGVEGVFYFWTRMNTKFMHKKRVPHLNQPEKNELTGRKANVSGAVWVSQVALYLGMGVFFWLISGQTAISFVPGPSIHPRMYETFLELKKRVPEGSVLLTWWDYGHTLIEVTGLATFHDGASQTGPKSYFIARGLISADQDELYDISQYLATEGDLGIAENNTSSEALITAVRNPTTIPWDPIYLFFTADMTGKYGAISKLGSWDIVKGGSKPRGYQNLACNKITSEEMNCRGAKINLKLGKINNQIALKRVVFIRDGEVIREQKFGHTKGYTLQMLVSGNQIIEVQMIDEEVYRSNYNQMFLLGRYDGELFEETYNAFPFSRLYKVKF